MNCREMSEFLQDYFAGDIPEAVASEFSVHISGCGNCTVYMEQYRQIIAGERALRAEDSACECPEELVQAIVAALRAAETE